MRSDVRLRPALPSDVPIFFQHQLDEAARRMAAFTTREAPEADAFAAKWARLLRDPAVLTRTILLDGEVVGHVARFPLGGVPNVTYWLARDAWGRGVATQALRLFLAEVPERPLHASAVADNTGSIRVLERCGFRRVGTRTDYAPAREAHVDETLYVLER